MHAGFYEDTSLQPIWVNTIERGCWIVWLRLCVLICLCEKLTNYLPKWLYHFVFPPVMTDSCCSSISSPAFGIVSIFNFIHPNRCVVVSHCFTSQFPHDIWYWASFHVLIKPSINFFGERSIQIFCLFLIGLFVF